MTQPLGSTDVPAATTWQPALAAQAARSAAEQHLIDNPYVRIVRQHGRLVLDGLPAASFGPQGDAAIGWARWQSSALGVTAQTCRYGIRPLFYYAGADRIMIAPSVTTLLALGAPAELDPDALAVFLRFENFIGEDTPFKHIRALPPAGRLEWSSTLRVTGDYWRPPRQTMSRTAALDAYVARFRAAVERAVAEPSLVPLSGGCDSRHIAFELARRGLLGECITLRSLPPRSNDDPRVASCVAAALGAPITVLDQGDDRFAATVRATVGSGYCGREHVWFQPLAAYLDRLAAEDQPLSAAPLLDGLGGDVLSAGLFLEARAHELFGKGRLDELARHYMRGHLGPLPFIADPGLAPPERAAPRLMQELEHHQGAANPVGSFFFWNRTRRVVALQFLALLPTRRVLTPYLDPDVFELLAGLPAEMFFDHGFHREAMHRAFPRYADIEFARSSHRGSSAARDHFRRYGRAVLRRLDTHPSRLLAMRFAKPRIRYLAWTGTGPAACWTADACLYLNLLEYAGREGSIARAAGGAF